MKKIIYLLITALALLSCSTIVKAQNSNIPFVGTWEWVNGNQIFRVALYVIEDNSIRGHFTMVQLNTNGIEETIIYKSNKDVGFGLTWGPSIYGGSDGVELSGLINDNSISNPKWLRGCLEMVILPSSGLNTITASWKVKRCPGLRVDGDTRVFNIPIDIILVKVQ